jgi:glycosyltransferase involved in cell wall biosynthesis
MDCFFQDFMLRITIDTRMLFMAGIGRYIREILSRMTSYEGMHITCLYQIVEQDRIKELPFYHECTWIPMRSKIFSISEQLELFIKSPQSDIFWSPQYNVPLMLPTHVKRRIVTIHDVYQLHDFKNLNLLKKAYVSLMMNYSVWKSDSILTVSNFSKQEIQKHTYFSGDKVICIYNGIDCQFSLNIESQPSNPPYILIVGNVKPHKNLRAAIQAFLQIEEMVPHELVIVGKKEGFLTGDSEAVEMTKGHPKIRFTGIVGDLELKRLYANTSLFVFPSLYEGFGLPILEAMSFSLPIIASNIPVIKELCGTSVTYFNPTSIDDISACMVRRLQTAPAKPNYSEILKRFQWSQAAEGHVKIFKQLSN